MRGAIINDDDQFPTASEFVDGKEFVFVSFGLGARWVPSQSSLASPARDFFLFPYLMEISCLQFFFLSFKCLVGNH